MVEDREKREQELQKERHRYEEALAKCDHEMKQQMDLLKGLVETLKISGEPISMSQMDRDKEIKVTKVTEADNIEAYLTKFERLMQAYEVPQEQWAFKLAPQLVGNAQQAYAALGPDDAKDYAILKKAILLRYDRATDRDLELLLERRVRLTENSLLGCRIWLISGLSNTKEELKDLIVLEQLVSTLPENVRIWVKEQKPKTSTEAGQLADDYTEARKQNSKVTSGDLTRRQVDQPPRCYQ